MTRHTVKLAARDTVKLGLRASAFASLFGCGAVFAQARAPAEQARAPAEQAPAPAERVAPESRGWTIAVVKIGYADAEELARLLSQLVPPSVKVAAYEPTNSLIIAGDPAVIGKLADGARHGEATKAKQGETRNAR